MTIYHQTCRKHITLDNARAWAKWLGQRYKDVPNIVWSLVPEAKPEFVPISAGIGRRPARRRRRPPPDHRRSRSLALLVQLPPQRELAGFQLHPDLERRQVDLSDGDQGLQSEAGQAGADGRRGVRGGHRSTASRSRRCGSAGRPTTRTWPAAITPTGTTTVGGCCPPGSRPWTRPARCRWACSRRSSWPARSGGGWCPTRSVFASGGRISDAPLPTDFATDKERSAYVRKLGPYQTGRKAHRQRPAPPGRPAPGRQVGHALSGRQGLVLRRHEQDRCRRRSTYLGSIRTPAKRRRRDRNPIPA